MTTTDSRPHRGWHQSRPRPSLFPAPNKDFLPLTSGLPSPSFLSPFNCLAGAPQGGAQAS